MPVIARQGCGDYRTAMMRRILRVLALVAVLLMPAGMAGAPAIAQAAPAPATGSGHCGDHDEPAQKSVQAQIHCTGCSALPALDGGDAATALMPNTPRVIAQMRTIPGIVLEIATPPPKLS